MKKRKTPLRTERTSGLKDIAPSFLTSVMPCMFHGVTLFVEEAGRGDSECEA